MFDMTDPTAILTLDGNFDTEYGMLAPEQTVIIRAYSDDSDDWMLDEIKPRFIVMFEPCMEFVRRVEVCVLINFVEHPLTTTIQVYKCSNPGLPVRVYHMVYANSCEEHKYLAAIRREKESFEKLIKERAVSIAFLCLALSPFPSHNTYFQLAYSADYAVTHL